MAKSSPSSPPQKRTCSRFPGEQHRARSLDLGVQGLLARGEVHHPGHDRGAVPGGLLHPCLQLLGLGVVAALLQELDELVAAQGPGRHGPAGLSAGDELLERLVGPDDRTVRVPDRRRLGRGRWSPGPHGGRCGSDLGRGGRLARRWGADLDVALAGLLLDQLVVLGAGLFGAREALDLGLAGSADAAEGDREGLALQVDLPELARRAFLELEAPHGASLGKEQAETIAEVGVGRPRAGRGRGAAEAAGARHCRARVIPSVS